MARSKNWRTRTRGTKRQRGKKFKLDTTSQQGKKSRLKSIIAKGFPSHRYGGIGRHWRLTKTELIAVAKERNVSYEGLTKDQLVKKLKSLPDGHLWLDAALYDSTYKKPTTKLDRERKKIADDLGIPMWDVTEDTIADYRKAHPKRETLFFPAKLQKYSKMVSLKSPARAKVSAEELLDEFMEAHTRAKMLRVKRVTILAMNRASVMAGNEKFSMKEREEARKMFTHYDNAQQRMLLRLVYAKHLPKQREPPTKKQKYRLVWKGRSLGARRRWTMGRQFVYGKEALDKAIADHKALGRETSYRRVKE